MPRRSREKSGTGVYHVMMRGINRQDIFEDDEDYQEMVGLLRYIHQNPVKAGIAEDVSSYPWSSWTEYASVENGFCSVRSVFTRVSKDNLLEMISTPVEDCDGILDIDTAGSRRVGDDEVRAFLLQRQGIQNPLMVQSLEKWRRNEVLKSAKQMGAGARQLARLTGISFGVIQKL